MRTHGNSDTWNPMFSRRAAPCNRNNRRGYSLAGRILKYDFNYSPGKTPLCRNYKTTRIYDIPPAKLLDSDIKVRLNKVKFFLLYYLVRCTYNILGNINVSHLIRTENFLIIYMKIKEYILLHNFVTSHKNAKCIIFYSSFILAHFFKTMNL